ncbi:hypothetical protein [Paenibacillus sp. DMB5]|uniref:hypothetical protein n=1 Tax=Paenibacillus sp. DMB5 TaxID=1780103 RepID=UPI00076C68E0|nr:hypothetical protein [Paenibacillus sp. DMB5]KUP21602.1 hypothetical protein AWJ19_05300 [Paenibacillus sp. DMB5]KUP26230.1 hypothetical protein AWJ19_24745 [Paenibacillus sp. DMB5]
MGNEFNKTEADFAYERYQKMGDAPPEQDIPLEDRRPLGTITEQGVSGVTLDVERQPLESSLASHEPIHERPVDYVDGIADEGADPALEGDSILAADIGVNEPQPALGRRADRDNSIIASPAPQRDELLESDSLFAAGAAGLTGSVIDYADDEESDEEVQPLEDVPDADELQPGTAVDPAAPPVDVMPGTDLLNGSTGEED